MKITEFLLCENPMRSGSRSEGGAGLFILKTSEPLCIIECVALDEEDPVGGLDDVFDFFEFKNADGLIEKHQLFLIRPKSASLTDQEALFFRKIIQKAWRWYRSYLEFEDENLDENEKSSEN